MPTTMLTELSRDDCTILIGALNLQRNELVRQIQASRLTTEDQKREDQRSIDLVDDLLDRLTKLEQKGERMIQSRLGIA